MREHENDLDNFLDDEQKNENFEIEKDEKIDPINTEHFVDNFKIAMNNHPVKWFFDVYEDISKN